MIACRFPILIGTIAVFTSIHTIESAWAQSTNSAQLPEQRFPDNQPPSLQPLPTPQLPPQLPPPDELLAPPQPAPVPSLPGEVPATIRVDRFDIVGSTVFTAAELASATAPFTEREITFAELLQARSAITQLYVDAGYITSGAYLPVQSVQDGIVRIEVVEGSLEAINIRGTERLRSSYVRDRLAIAAETPLNVNRLLEGLQLLQLDPLIENISADLQAGARPGTSLLVVDITEAPTFRADVSANNNRSPSVGSFRRQVNLTQANLLGFGDGLSLGYSNTDGSNTIDASYTIPLNPRNGTLQLAIGFSDSEVIEEPFDALDINATSRYYEITFRQPLSQSPTEEFALGLTASRQESQTELGFNDIGPFALSSGADEQGRTRISALRFFQEWTQRSDRQVLAARSQFSLGLDFLDATINEDEPDSRFFAWRGQGQWVRLLDRDALLLVRGDIQLADSTLVPLEQFGLGGQQTVRGYRQDALLTDNGALLSAEVRLPIVRVPEWQGLLQLSPFVDVGTTWNNQSELNSNTLVGAGLGLIWQQSDNFSARLDWGIPLIPLDSSDRTLQENGLYFSIIYRPF
ncbi:ShlB/FhaC/HecB family hemolysin secretion/activation protein [Microcoleus sp. FACHB-1515]|uniref:ShlB/FhaC/HecB family hemolysin secretion/activation protein n=1 Tax=Cyanophyceae TaxID=3028117 RepID=UPI001687E752|nr:ShlB/FhaC/HecB family hemolysin secretion/activation protein [Microcoleus sp. FACHB-1515]MBD2092617.1 ShlB/FhaC/HecB family hemolysin secretion/activation protein [Microcoleus sp. FACHB-1515]